MPDCISMISPFIYLLKGHDWFRFSKAGNFKIIKKCYFVTTKHTAIYKTKLLTLTLSLFSHSFTKVPGLVQDILYLTAVLNTCINPLIYGVYYYSERGSQYTRDNSSRNNLASFRSHSNVSHMSASPQTTKSVSLRGRRETLKPFTRSSQFMSRKFGASQRCQLKITDEEFELVKLN